MPRPRFSEMLIERRHQLGLTVGQASKVLKLREDVLVAFEEGDFVRMPQSGYAQGMLSSYARYLGLNAREVVDVFQEEYYLFKNGTTSHELRRRTRDTQSGRGITGYDVVNEQGSRPKAYIEYRPLLPTSGGPAGDISGFTTTTEARPHRSVPLAGTASAPGTRGYSSSADSGSGYGQDPHQQQGRSYNSGSPHSSVSPSAQRRRTNAQRRRQDQAGRLLSEGQNMPDPNAYRRQTTLRASDRLYRRDDVSTRRVSAGDYADDMRFDDTTSPYAPASTLSGRRSSRNIASVERPNVRRRQASPGRGGAPARSGRRGRRNQTPVQAFFSDPRRALLALIVVLAAVLTCILIFSVSSCVNAKGGDTGGQTVSVNNASTDDGSKDSSQGGTQSQTDSTQTQGQSTDGSSTQGTTSDSTSTQGQGTTGDSTTDSTQTEPQKTVVEVSVAQGSVTWLNIECDGKSVVADTLTGPWTQSFEVTDKIQIEASKPENVTVTDNGKQVEFSTKSSGRGTVTINGTPATTAESSTTEGTTGSTGTTGTSGTATASGTTSATGTKTTQSTGTSKTSTDGN